MIVPAAAGTATPFLWAVIALLAAAVALFAFLYVRERKKAPPRADSEPPPLIGDISEESAPVCDELPSALLGGQAGDAVRLAEHEGFFVFITLPPGEGADGGEPLSDYWKSFRDEPFLIAPVEALPKNDDLCCVCGFAEGGEQAARALVLELMERLQATRPGVSFGIGGTVRGAGAIAQSYEQARRAMERVFFAGRGSVVRWTAGPAEKKKFFNPKTYENHIVNYIMTGDAENVRRSLGELIVEIRRQDGMTYSNVMHIIHQLVGAVVRYVAESNVDEITGIDHSVYPKIAGAGTLEDLESFLSAFFTDICEKLTPPRAVDYGALIISYIQKNYKSDIAFEEMAASMGISYSYARKVVRDKLGKGISEYLISLKLEAAKELLLTTKRSITSISEEIGFSNVQSLNRFFKKYDGITPSEFRQNNEKRAAASGLLKTGD